MNGALTRAGIAMGVALLVSVVAFVLLGPITRGPGSSSDKKFDVGRAGIAVAVQPDAALRVTENLRFRFSSDDFTGAYRDIALTDETQLTGLSVRDGEFGRYASGADTELGSDGQPGTFGITTSPGGERVVWHYGDQHGGSRTFTLKYRAVRSVDAYDDVVYVHWAVWGDQWKFTLPQLSAALTMPDPASGDGRPLRAWLTPGQLDAEPSVTGGGATVAVKRVPTSTQVVLSAVYPRSAFTSVKGAVEHPGNGRAMLEREADDAEPTSAAKLSNGLWAHAVPVTVLFLLLVLALVGVALWFARERPTAVPKYLPTPPSEATPAVAYGLASEGTYSERVVLATLLDLVDRGYYAQSAGSGVDDVDRLDLILATKPTPSRPAAPLSAGEAAVLDFFDQLIGDEPGALSLLQFRIPAHSAEWRARWEAMNTALAADGLAGIEHDLDLRRARWGVVAFAIVVFGLMALGGYERAHDEYIPLIGLVLSFGLIAAPRGVALQRLTPKVREQSAQWQAFARWTRDFPRLGDDAPATLLLWKRVLVYGVAFGTAKRVIESGRIPAEVMASPEFFAGSTPYLFGSSRDFGQSFGSGFSSQVASQSSSGAGGGGGGGGGSSGGGGGGAW